MSAHPLEIDCGSVQLRIASGEDFLLLDCREPDEHAIVKLPLAHLLPMSEIEGRVGEIEKYRQQKIVVYCHHGMRSLQVVSWLRQLGFDNAQSMTGGIDAWSREVDPSVPRY